MKIELARPSELTAGDIAAWDAIQAADPDLDSPFLSPGWALAVERAQVSGAARYGARVAAISSTDGARGYFAFRRRGVTAMPLGAPMCDYQALVGQPGLALDGRVLVEGLKVDRLDVSHAPTDQALFAPHIRGRDLSRQVDLSLGYEAYVAERRAAGSGLLKDLDKRRRKAEREIGPVRFEAGVATPEAFDSLIAWKRGLMRATHQTDIFEAGWPLRLLRDLLGSDDPACAGRLFTLSIGDRLAAVHLHLLGRRTVHAWIIGHDPQLEQASPGLLLFQDILRWMDGGPLSRLDFGGGDYRFKQQFANAGREIGHGFIGRPSAAALIRQAEYGVRAAAERLPWPRVSALPGKAMRRMDLWRGLS